MRIGRRQRYVAPEHTKMRKAVLAGEGGITPKRLKVKRMHGA
jgi:hypothetical protein